ncbi:hypothetical protein ES754_05655 [Psychrobacter frigidicola]|uniref:Uncharacterized protein n=1 Tax=Psychrobacter frigidicola TaxID=45611 RepID=A0A5C7A555_9GAMM|nr:hypothetical protein [Psychrobacter frigidicola]TXD98402.1 hypothetical protein ES754_05655 [Psychrobacter frigidicola]
MNLNTKSLEKLRMLINEETSYRKGFQLVDFFNSLGFNDIYGQGFPSRSIYTNQKLEIINGTPRMEQCIKAVLYPASFIDKLEHLDECIETLNKYIAFDKWKVIRNSADINFQRLDKVEVKEPSKSNHATTENQFLSREFSNISVQKIGLEGMVSEVIEGRIKEIERCYSSDAYLSVIIIAGSTLEGVLLGLANQYPRHFNTAKSSPKDKSGKVYELSKWSLSSFIDVAYELGLVQHDIQRFSHTLRDFRNYTHPYQQMSFGFNPREHTAKICLHVLKAAIQEISENVSKINT